MSIIFTPREKHVLTIAILTLLAIIVSGVDQQTLNDYELIWLIFYVFPLGLYIATDPARSKFAGK